MHRIRSNPRLSDVIQVPTVPSLLVGKRILVSTSSIYTSMYVVSCKLRCFDRLAVDRSLRFASFPFSHLSSDWFLTIFILSTTATGTIRQSPWQQKNSQQGRLCNLQISNTWQIMDFSSSKTFCRPICKMP